MSSTIPALDDNVASRLSREPASVCSFIYLSVAAPPRQHHLHGERVGRVAWHRPASGAPALCVALVVLETNALKGFR